MSTQPPSRGRGDSNAFISYTLASPSGVSRDQTGAVAEAEGIESSDADAARPEEADAEANAPQAPTPEMIERFRQVGLHLDRGGRLWHQGREVTHPRLKRAILSWIDRREGDGRPIVRMDEHRYAYIEIEDAELLATSARWEGDRVFVVLNDGSEQELEYESLRVRADHALYCSVRGGRLAARLTTAAAHALAAGLVEREDGGFDLRAAGERFPIRPA